MTGWATGDRAGITFLGTTCGTCEWCAAGRERFCPKQTNFGYTLQGALGDYAIAPAAALVRVPDGLSGRRCGAALLRRLDRLSAPSAKPASRRARSLALFGYGGLGHLALQIALHQGLRVAVSDPSEEKLDGARSGADLAGAAHRTHLQKSAAEWMPQSCFTAAPAAIPQAFRALQAATAR